jgi:hypothetical protein
MSDSLRPLFEVDDELRPPSTAAGLVWSGLQLASCTAWLS